VSRQPRAPDEISIIEGQRDVSFLAERDASATTAGKRQRAKARPPKAVAASAGGVAAPNPPQPSPTAPAPPEAELRRFGNWLVLGLDGVGKRAACMCDCGTIREVAVHALEEGATTSCGCSKSTVAPVDRSPSLAFSRDLAALENRAASGRHRRRT
jgi:hypothetical protein